MEWIIKESFDIQNINAYILNLFQNQLVMNP